MLKPPSRRLEALLHPPRNRAQVSIDLARVLAQNQRHDALARNVDVLEAAEDVDLLVGQDDAGAARVLDGELCLPVLAGNAADGAAHVLALQGLDVLDLKGLDVQVVEAQQGDGVVDVEAQREGLDKVLALLQRVGRRRQRRGAQLDRARLDVHAHLQVQVLDEGGLRGHISSARCENRQTGRRT
jgi:hypothetical protein